MPSTRTEFPGSQGATLAARLDTPYRTPRACAARCVDRRRRALHNRAHGVVPAALPRGPRAPGTRGRRRLTVADDPPPVPTMGATSPRIFISYRRDDAVGYAGRLEESLERRLGRGSAFRDIGDIAPGEDFLHVIRARLAEAQAVLVLIGPRWVGAGGAGRRRLDDPGDFVRLEVQEALASGARVVPVLLPGAAMPAEDDLPPPLKPLARRNALVLSDAHWDADIARLLASVGASPRRAVWPWAAGGALAAAAAVAALCVLRPDPAADTDARLIGRWEADVRYDWGDRHTERFEFERHAGELTATASFLGHPRPVQALRVDGANLHFETRTRQSMGDDTREQTHAYAAELRGRPPDEVLAFRMQTTGGFSSHRPLTFEARRVTATDVAPAGTRP